MYTDPEFKLLGGYRLKDTEKLLQELLESKGKVDTKFLRKVI